MKEKLKRYALSGALVLSGMQLFGLHAAAQESSTQQQPAGGNMFGTIGYLIFMVLILVVMYFVLFRPQRQKEKETKAMQSAVQIGDEIVTIGGIVGLVVQIGEDTLVIETTGNRNKLRIKTWAIQENLTMSENKKREDDAKLAAAKEKAKKDEKKGKDEKKDAGILKD